MCLALALEGHSVPIREFWACFRECFELLLYVFIDHRHTSFYHSTYSYYHPRLLYQEKINHSKRKERACFLLPAHLLDRRRSPTLDAAARVTTLTTSLSCLTRLPGAITDELLVRLVRPPARPPAAAAAHYFAALSIPASLPPFRRSPADRLALIRHGI